MDMPAEPLNFQCHTEIGLFRIHTKGRLQFIKSGSKDEINAAITDLTVPGQKYVVLQVFTVDFEEIGEKDAED
jgi:hypothetical protein